MKFLTENQFERQNFIHYIKTGRFYQYLDYLEWKKLIERKSLIDDYEDDDDEEDEDSESLTEEQKQQLEESKKMMRKILPFLPTGDGGDDDNKKKLRRNPFPQEPVNDNEDENFKYCIWNGGTCNTCQELSGNKYKVEEVPEQPHPNCTCTCDVIGSDEKIKPRPKTPKKPKCTSISSPKQDARMHPNDKVKKPHYGTDFAVPIGTPIKSPVNGTVVRNDNIGANGNRVAIYDDTTKTEHHFYHMESPSPLSKGSEVTQGQEVGLSGNSGKTSDGVPYKPHLHYETRDTKIPNDYPDNVIEPKQEDLDYLDKQFTDIHGCR